MSCFFNRVQFDETFTDFSKLASVEAFKIARKLVQTFNSSKDKERIEVYSR